MRSRLANWLEQQWVRIGCWHILLIPMSWLFWLLSTCRRKAYEFGVLKSYRSAVPLIVVGNISVGGTGKTPLVIWLVERLKQAGFSPGIISRGYGSKFDTPRTVGEGSRPGEFGDEPVLLARRAHCPVWVGVDRVAVQQALLRAQPQCNVIVSDDGLQHYRMQRDIELAVVDAERGFGNGQLMPAGPLREPLSRLSTVDAVVYNDAGKNEHGKPEGFSMSLQGCMVRNLLEQGKTMQIADLQGRAVHAIAGIGNPQRFFQQLRSMGLSVEAHPFTDHHDFRPEDLAFAGESMVLMTEKDAVKCAGFARPNWWYLPVDAEVDPVLADYIIRRLRK
ncbi:MAG: tetraacyldisaccharide 4'-kinase [Betaproteobacteria bacterium HGW-Betaproteobacteria-8]|nr:MAG: tetraacyldisaccharide 4'-kinase [Betaproteobacteria bacterium HGW-Betaproteobacteria-8]